MINNRAIKTTCIISFLGHCLLLSMPLSNIELFQPKQPENITVKVEIERPRLLPKIKQLGEEKKLKKIKEAKKETMPEPQIAEKTQEHLEPKPKETALHKEPRQLINKENIEILKPDNEAMLRYQDMIKQKIEEARRYPFWAKKRGVEGVVYIDFIILPDGLSQNINIIHSAGSKILDNESIATIQRANPFPPIPHELNQNFVSIETAIVFRIK